MPFINVPFTEISCIYWSDGFPIIKNKFHRFIETITMNVATGLAQLMRTQLIQTSAYLKLLPKSLHLFNAKINF